MVEPICPYFGSCGGCSAQHIDYSLQLENKKKQLERVIPGVPVKVFSAEPYGYRNRMDLIFHPKGLGFREKDTWHKIVDIERCAIANETLNTLIKEIRAFFSEVDAFDVKKHIGTFRYAVIRTPQDSSISFVLNADSSRIADAVEKIKVFAQQTSAHTVLVSYVPAETDVSISDDFFVVKGSDMLHETYVGKTFWYSAQGFFQNNSVMGEKMQEYVHSLLGKYGTEGAHLLDLYGGVGTFGIINSPLFKSTTIVESVSACIEAATKNIKKNAAKNTTSVVLDAIQLKKLPLKQPLFVITDPPRSGMHQKTIEHLNFLKPNVIIYISCNLQQLAKELPKFSKYTVKSAAVFDLFPQTPHSEAVVELVRKELI